ncbi:YheC/YheD family protein [Bacillus sp. DTU_2020_1000418_1_SI_GHA_SEK_038]|uniref:YheC/YheD family protein n=1 Tax=Bacillus sp. DTU_2020_1000418_1_SI_GHA_SEK_038 TaxID=3077585 RepID=UPI0028F15C73|nr:YheC/YheD family protein [Bacillus sp. DTU_2020_1000418_1_SI_GHA_SEK_038]WNS75836.1 YheC/YheD family protein [Bacillus sp. DTU_2020_1000418_1_SI_GHA_SEK_038]
MRPSKGRMSQFKILHSDESFSKHLLETELFSEATLFSFLEKYKSVVIKPAFGWGEVFVTFKNNKFKIFSEVNEDAFIDREDLYQYLRKNKLKHKNNIIQPARPHSGLFQGPFYFYLVTLHRNSPATEWHYMSSTDKYGSPIGKYFNFDDKMENLSILAAKKLGDFYPDCHTVVLEIGYELMRGLWIQDSILHFPKSKWNQFQTLSTNHSISPFVPKTDLLTKVSFNEYLNKYNEIIIKPCVGQHGLGIVKITMTDSSTFEIHTGRIKQIKSNMEETYDFIHTKYLSKNQYLVQERLSLAEIDGCPLDVRVIVQKVESSWIVTGKIVKVAGKGFFVTNAAQKLLSLGESLHNSNFSVTNLNQLEYEVDSICIFASEQLEVNHPDIKMIGFDIGISEKGDIWIIEGNYKPDLSMFSGLKDKDIYTNIRKVMKSQRKNKNDSN